ncbi:TIGR02757 family protein [Rhodohalobacter sp. SW132]|uniref:TIGR02757 family protein n=1 Tax=Rhodohalobacter sp. SW132 TaxID=2293433 RepID=UPI000E23A7B7|nr:TIGR02757 family protein [Rhodohalobacter sp. SW132]REL33189.1 TIGR02757 family protein [Rhodohalobacter sp. SW132]
MKPKSPLRKRSRKALIELKPLLDEINDRVEQPDYIPHDPVQFMHAFEEKKDREIAGFLAATMAWGRRDIVVSKVDQLLRRMDYQPYDFVMHYSQKDFSSFSSFKHRTFKPIDIHGLVLALRAIYSRYDDFESFWRECYETGKSQNRPFLAIFNERFFSFSSDFAERTRKHISNPEKGSPCKRLYMFLRWTIRKNSPVDTGIWSFMPESELLIPLDVHVARQARKFGLITRRSNDWQTVNQLTETLAVLNPNDPARYDYALFGIGALDYEIPLRYHLNRV